MAGHQGVCTHKIRDGGGAPINARSGAPSAGRGRSQAPIGAAAGERKNRPASLATLGAATLGATMLDATMLDAKVLGARMLDAKMLGLATLGVTSVKNNGQVLRSYRAANEA